MAWVKWEKITQLKNHGKLGIKKVNLFNDALLAKWRWGMFHNSYVLWCKVLKSIYGEWRGLIQEYGCARYSSIWWRNLRKVCGENSQVK
uniref:Uncharacterized protein n=1 Tax=Cajanus cajan TaxID=3821 RepID=A0A151T2F5_CAJCA|nr:hypothetical protein KK1_023652 [Cajanus cajan]